MEMQGERRIPAPRQLVWERLNDPETLKECIPGCESVDKVSDTEFTAKVRAKVEAEVKASGVAHADADMIHPGCCGGLPSRGLQHRQQGQ